MKSIIESSVYLFLMALICFISVSFINMNIEVTKVNEATTYLENFVEAQGVCETKTNISGDKYIVYYKDGVEVTPGTAGAFPKAANNLLESIAHNIEEIYGYKVNFRYIDMTNNYVYVSYSITYQLSNGLLRFFKSHTYNGIARFSVIGQ